MKSNFIALCFLAGFSIILINKYFFYVFAQTNKPQIASPSSVIIDENIKTLKDKIATKVAELQKQNKKVLTGLILKKYEDAIELKSDENIYKVVIDETLTKIYLISNNVQKEIKFEELAKNDFVIMIGNLMDNSISTNFIYKDQQYNVGSGKVIEVNKNDYTLRIITTEKDELLLNIETVTKQQILDIKSLTISPAGFSKIKDNDTIHFVTIKPTGGNSSRLSALRTLIIPQEYFALK